MNKRLVNAYLIGTFLLAYLSWGMILLAQEMGWFQYGHPISMIFIVIGANSPAIIAYFVLKESDKDVTLTTYLKDAFAFRQKPIHYAISILFIATTFVVPAIMGGIMPEIPPVIGGTEYTAPMPLWLTMIGIPLFFILGGSEELGWRYVLQQAFEKKMAFIPSVLVVSFIWSIWHLPLFFIIGTSQYAVGFLPFAISTIGSAFALAGIYRVSNSIWLCILFHCATNSLQGTWSIANDVSVNVYTSIVLTVLSLAIVLQDIIVKKKAKIHATAD